MYIYLLLINLFGFVVMGTDKARARKSARRIAENKIMLVALAGGAAGVFLGMHLFRHKTRHFKFTLGLPLIILVQLIFYKTNL